jgi:hypothetical protein
VILTQVVNAPPPATTTTILTSSLNPSTFGQSVTFTAAVTTASGTPTGTVTFFDGTTILGTGTLSGGTATFTTATLTVGSHNITATYAGNSSYAAATSVILTQVVNAPPPATTTTILTSSLNPSTFGQSVSFTAAVTTASGTPTGTVTFFDGTTILGTGTLSGGTATFTTATLTVGSHNITATYAGNSSYAAGTSVILTQVVNAEDKEGLKVYPSPVIDEYINLKMSGMPPGKYYLRLINSLGRTVLTKEIILSGNSTGSFLIGKRVTGIYFLEIIKPDKSKVSRKIMLNHN